jgi:hypothetical protein
VSRGGDALKDYDELACTWRQIGPAELWRDVPPIPGIFGGDRLSVAESATPWTHCDNPFSELTCPTRPKQMTFQADGGAVPATLRCLN